MNIVFLVHYFPPLNSTGARRVLAFSKYLHRAGHKINIVSTIKTPNDGLLSESVPDYCNLVEVSWFKRKNKPVQIDGVANTTGDRSKLGHFLVKIKRGFMKYAGQLIDHRLLFASYFLNPFLPKSLQKVFHEADVIISSCPPWPVHLAGLICSKRFNKKWLADYRDQFSGNHVFVGNKLTQNLECVIEKWLLKAATSVIVISPPMRDYYLQFNQNVYCIENGYDDEQFALAEKMLTVRTGEDKIYVRYMGTISRYRVPEIFFAALAQLDKNIRKNIVVEFYGESKPAEEFIETQFPELIENVKFFGVVSHQQAIRLMLESDALLFQETTSFADSASHSSRGAMSAKLFEYLAAKKPIIAEVEPNNLMGQAVIQSGLCCACTLDIDEMAQALNRWLCERFEVKPNLQYITKFSRKTKTMELEEVIRRVLVNEVTSENI